MEIEEFKKHVEKTFHDTVPDWTLLTLCKFKLEWKIRSGLELEISTKMPSLYGFSIEFGYDDLSSQADEVKRKIRTTLYEFSRYADHSAGVALWTPPSPKLKENSTHDWNETNPSVTSAPFKQTCFRCWRTREWLKHEPFGFAGSWKYSPDDTACPTLSGLIEEVQKRNSEG